jgi:hypothetical protein
MGFRGREPAPDLLLVAEMLLMPPPNLPSSAGPISWTRNQITGRAHHRIHC